ncbi:MAG: TorF family putative porin [Pseudomonadota bacterium]
MLRKLCTSAVCAAALMCAPAVAQEEDEGGLTFLGGSFSANVAITTDYTFRGISQSSSDAAIQGGFDWASDLFYVGTWGSTVDFNDDLSNPITGEQISDGSSTEIDFYAGFTPSVGDVGLDFGFIYYLYPNAPGGNDDVIVPTTLTPDQASIAAGLGVAPGEVLVDFNDQDYVELYGSASYAVGPLELGFSLTWSPDYYFETGDLILPVVSASLPLGSLSDVGGSGVDFALSGNVGRLFFLDDLVPEGGGFGEDYWDFGVGVTATWYGIDFDARYIDTAGLAGNGSTGVFTVSKSF